MAVLAGGCCAALRAKITQGPFGVRRLLRKVAPGGLVGGVVDDRSEQLMATSAMPGVAYLHPELGFEADCVHHRLLDRGLVRAKDQRRLAVVINVVSA